MAQKIILTIVACMVAMVGYAKDPQRGYRGFVDWEYSLGYMNTTNDVDGYHRGYEWLSGVTTSHGYQFNSHIFLGAGTGIVPALSAAYVMFPVFVDFRYDYSHRKFRPFGDVRIGYNISDGFYMSPTIGYRLNWGRKMNVNFGVGMTLLGMTDEISTHSSDVYHPSSKKRRYAETFFTLRIGIDF